MSDINHMLQMHAVTLGFICTCCESSAISKKLIYHEVLWCTANFYRFLASTEWTQGYCMRLPHMVTLAHLQHKWAPQGKVKWSCGSHESESIMFKFITMAICKGLIISWVAQTAFIQPLISSTLFSYSALSVADSPRANNRTLLVSRTCILHLPNHSRTDVICQWLLL